MKSFIRLGYLLESIVNMAYFSNVRFSPGPMRRIGRGKSKEYSRTGT